MYFVKFFKNTEFKRKVKNTLEELSKDKKYF